MDLSDQSAVAGDQVNFHFMKASSTEIKQILQITLVWLIIGVAAVLYDYSLTLTPYVTLHGITLRQMLLTQVVTTPISSFVTGILIVKFFMKWIRRRSYGRALLMILAVYTLMSMLTGLVTMNIFLSGQTGVPAFSWGLQTEVFGFIFGPVFVRYYGFWLMVLLGTMIAFLVNDKYGPGVFKEFLLGRYFHPRRTERIFMFLDLRGSTTIAERLGEVEYFAFLQDVFMDVTPAILNSRGEIYKYVGDEIIVTWKMDRGLKNNACITCFDEVQNTLMKKSKYYVSNFGTAPEFKAGLHCGFVIAGELGAVKREIAFSGDVLNTTARIQAKCNELRADILFSEELSERLAKGWREVDYRRFPDVKLAGKAEQIVLYGW